MIIEANATTGQIVEREMNDDELAQYESDQAQATMKDLAEAKAATAKAALLEKLGITEEEAKLLLS